VMREHRAAIDAAGAAGVIAKPILSIEQFGADIRRFMRCRAAAAPSAAGGQAAGMGGDNATAEGIDRDVYDLLAQSIGPAAMAELLDKVDSDLRGARTRLAKALQPPDFDEIRAVTHILISIAGAVGAVQLQDQAGRVNAAAHRNNADDLSTGARRLLGMIDGALRFLAAQAEA
jgi:two-component system aerobic respiration control sensor histidine kinase ArcB